MRKWIFPVVLGVVMAVTNPSMQEYREYVQTEITSTINQQGGGVVGGLATVFGAQRTMADLVVSNTKRDDYLILSVYTFTVGNKRTQYLGAFKHFFFMNSHG